MDSSQLITSQCRSLYSMCYPISSINELRIWIKSTPIWSQHLYPEQRHLIYAKFINNNCTLKVWDNEVKFQAFVRTDGNIFSLLLRYSAGIYWALHLYSVSNEVRFKLHDYYIQGAYDKFSKPEWIVVSYTFIDLVYPISVVLLIWFYRTGMQFDTYFG